MPTENRPTVDQCIRTSPLDKSTKVVNTVNTGYLGQCKVIQDNATSRYLLLKEMVFNGEEEFVNAVQFVQMQKSIRDEGLLYIIDYSTEKVNNFCSSFYNLRVYFLPHLEELRKLTKEREKAKEGLTEKEMTYMLFHLTHGLAELHKAGLTHKHISPESVDTTNLVGRNPKLIYLEDGSTTNVKQVTYNNIFKSKDLFVAPEIFEKATSLVKSSNTAGALNFDEQKLDAFSLGMTLLYAGCGHSVQDCYDTKTFRFNKQRLDSYVAEFKSKYAINPMVTEAVEKLVDLDVNNRTSAISLQSELPRLEEINQYFEVIGDDSMQGDYNEKFPLSAEDRRAGEKAKSYLISKNRLYQVGSGPITTFNQGASNQGTATQQGSVQDQRAKQGLQPGPTADLRPGQAATSFGVAGAAQTNSYGTLDASRQAQAQGTGQYGSTQQNGAQFFDSQYPNQSVRHIQQNSSFSNPAQTQPTFAPFNATANQTGTQQTGQFNQSNLNNSYQTQPQQLGSYGAQQTSNQTGQQGFLNQSSTQQGQAWNSSSSKNPLMNFMYPGSSGQKTQTQSDQQAIGVAQKPLASKQLTSADQGQAQTSFPSQGQTQYQPSNGIQIQTQNYTDQSRQADASRTAASTRPGAVTADHRIFSRPPVQQQQPAAQAVASPIGSALLSTMKRSASQPIRIGTHAQSESVIHTPIRTSTAQTSLASRPVTYSQTNLHSAYVPAQTRVSDNTYPRSYSPLVVTKPQTTFSQSTSGLVSGNSRIRSSSHNIIRNGVVIDTDNPTQELRASRIVVTGDKVDYYMDESAARHQQQFSAVHSPAVQTFQTKTYAQAQPTYVHQSPTYVHQAPVYSQQQQPSFASKSYYANTPVRTSTHVAGLQSYTPHHATVAAPLPAYVSAPRVYATGSPARFAHPVAYGSTRVVAHNAAPVYAGSFAGNAVTPRRVVHQSGSYATPRPVQQQVIYQPQAEARREELATPRNEEQMLESKYIADQIHHLTEAQPVKTEQPVNRRDDSEIKPRELESGEGEQHRLHHEDAEDKTEPNWTDN
jgi:serine/threonine protein kinase